MNAHSPRARLGGRLIALASVAHLGMYLWAAPEHVVDRAWPLHARFHVLQAILWIAALDVALAALGLWAFPGGARWARFTLLGGWLGAHVGYFAAIAAIPAGRPPELSAHLALAAPLVLYAVGLGLGWRHRRESPG